MLAKLNNQTNRKWRKILDALRPKQRSFVEQYCENGGNATQSAIDAEYKCKNYNSFAQMGSDNLKKPKVIAAIEVYREYLTGKAEKIALYTRAQAIDDYDTAMKLAKEYGQAGAMCTAISGKADLCGLNYKPADNPADSRPMTREELEEQLRTLDDLEKDANIIQLEVNRRVS